MTPGVYCNDGVDKLDYFCLNGDIYKVNVSNLEEKLIKQIKHQIEHEQVIIRLVDCFRFKQFVKQETTTTMVKNEDKQQQQYKRRCLELSKQQHIHAHLLQLFDNASIDDLQCDHNDDDDDDDDESLLPPACKRRKHYLIDRMNGMKIKQQKQQLLCYAIVDILDNDDDVGVKLERKLEFEQNQTNEGNAISNIEPYHLINYKCVKIIEKPLILRAIRQTNKQSIKIENQQLIDLTDKGDNNNSNNNNNNNNSSNNSNMIINERLSDKRSSTMATTTTTLNDNNSNSKLISIIYEYLRNFLIITLQTEQYCRVLIQILSGNEFNKKHMAKDFTQILNKSAYILCDEFIKRIELLPSLSSYQQLQLVEVDGMLIELLKQNDNIQIDKYKLYSCFHKLLQSHHESICNIIILNGIYQELDGFIKTHREDQVVEQNQKQQQTHREKQQLPKNPKINLVPLNRLIGGVESTTTGGRQSKPQPPLTPPQTPPIMFTDIQLIVLKNQIDKFLELKLITSRLMIDLNRKRLKEQQLQQQQKQQQELLQQQQYRRFINHVLQKLPNNQLPPPPVSGSLQSSTTHQSVNNLGDIIRKVDSNVQNSYVNHQNRIGNGNQSSSSTITRNSYPTLASLTPPQAQSQSQQPRRQVLQERRPIRSVKAQQNPSTVLPLISSSIAPSTVLLSQSPSSSNHPINTGSNLKECMSNYLRSKPTTTPLTYRLPTIPTSSSSPVTTTINQSILSILCTPSVQSCKTTAQGVHKAATTITTSSVPLLKTVSVTSQPTSEESMPIQIESGTKLLQPTTLSRPPYITIPSPPPPPVTTNSMTTSVPSTTTTTTISPSNLIPNLSVLKPSRATTVIESLKKSEPSKTVAENVRGVEEAPQPRTVVSSTESLPVESTPPPPPPPPVVVELEDAARAPSVPLSSLSMVGAEEEGCFGEYANKLFESFDIKKEELEQIYSDSINHEAESIIDDRIIYLPYDDDDDNDNDNDDYINIDDLDKCMKIEDNKIGIVSPSDSGLGGSPFNIDMMTDSINWNNNNNNQHHDDDDDDDDNGRGINEQQSLIIDGGGESFTCLCGKKACYQCACKTATYCSETCRLYDWRDHRRLCSRIIMTL